jgi:serine/threonine-protein kinase HipA
VNKAYERVVFNVVFNNRDDHAKNLSYRLGEDRAWRLAPAYDLIYNEGPGGEHQMDVCGEGRQVSRAKMMELARHGDVGKGFAQASLDKALALVDELPDRAQAHAIRPATLRTIRAAVVRNRDHLR